MKRKITDNMGYPLAIGDTVMLPNFNNLEAKILEINEHGQLYLSNGSWSLPSQVISKLRIEKSR